jgi:Fe-S cluster assembly iron-binding protein IscA
MLTITPQASEAIRGILDSENVPDGSMLRISSQPAEEPQPGPGLLVSLIESPPPEDQIVAGDEVEICVEPATAEMLDDKELDAMVAEGQVNFSIGQQAA